MATLVYWNNLNANNAWEDWLNWSYDDAGTLPLSSFDGSEYFLWTGTGAGATDDCTLSSNISCAGFYMNSSVNSVIAIVGSFAFSCVEDMSTVPGGITANFDFDGFTCSNTVNFYIGQYGTPGTFNVEGSSSTGQRFDTVYMDATSATLNLFGNWEMRTLSAADDATINALSSNGCTLILTQEDASPAVDYFGVAGVFNLGCSISVQNCSTTPVFDPAIILNVATEGAMPVILGICRGPLSVALPQWAVDHSVGGDLAVGFNQYLPYYNGLSIAGEWTNLDILDGLTFNQLSLTGSICGNSNQTIGFQFTGAAPITVTCGYLDLSGGPRNTTGTRYYSLGDPVTIDVTTQFTTADYGNIEYGLLFPSNHLQCTRFYAPAIQGWDGLTDDRNISLTGANSLFVADFAIGRNAWITDLNAVTPGRPFYMFGRSALLAAPSSDIINMHGKLNLPDNDLRWRHFPAGTLRINLDTGANAAAVVDITGALQPVSI